MSVRAYSWLEADRWVRHCHMVAAVGRPADWGPLDDATAHHDEMLSRCDAVLGSVYAGTEQNLSLKAFADGLRAQRTAPPPVVHAEVAHLEESEDVSEHDA